MRVGIEGAAPSASRSQSGHSTDELYPEAGTARNCAGCCYLSGSFGSPGGGGGGGGGSGGGHGCLGMSLLWLSPG